MTTAEAIEVLANKKHNFHFRELRRICEKFFGEARVRSSHYTFKVAVIGENLTIPRHGSKVKACYIKQVLRALRMLEVGEYNSPSNLTKLIAPILKFGFKVTRNTKTKLTWLKLRRTLFKSCFKII